MVGIVSWSIDLISIYIVSLLPSFLTSAVFGDVVTQQSNHKIVDVVIQDCQFSSEYMIASMRTCAQVVEGIHFVDSRCCNILTKNDKYCDFCDVDISDNSQWEYTITGVQWTLKDPHSEELYTGVYCSWFALKVLLVAYYFRLIEAGTVECQHGGLSPLEYIRPEAASRVMSQEASSYTSGS